MAKKGTKRPEKSYTQPGSQQKPVHELQRDLSRKREKAVPNNNGVGASGQTAFYRGRPIPMDMYPLIDTDLARDNVENDAPAADLAEHP